MLNPNMNPTELTASLFEMTNQYGQVVTMLAELTIAANDLKDRIERQTIKLEADNGFAGKNQDERRINKRLAMLEDESLAEMKQALAEIEIESARKDAERKALSKAIESIKIYADLLKVS